MIQKQTFEFTFINSWSSEGLFCFICFQIY